MPRPNAVYTHGHHESVLRSHRWRTAANSAGRRLLSWAREAGFTDVTADADVWCFATEADRAWWSGLWAERTTGSAYARLAVEGGHADRAELERIAAAWREWGGRPDGWFSVPHGQILCRA
ncbi:hypothetical protein IQ279_18390 [Streptomyces verrucosisporus]|nr:hypothetical protein [Streptomyces verrucosisporus]